jgi:[Skp1-protein]-hydroxyproline N-acetylglucosaminyltransferase
MFPLWVKILPIILLVLFVYIIYVRIKKRIQKNPNNDESSTFIQTQYSIFVSISSYRESECAQTIINLFRAAAKPNNVVVGLCEHIDFEKDMDTLTKYEYLIKGTPDEQQLRDLSSHIRRIQLAHTDAKGTLHARSIIENLLFRNETYYFIIDAHTRFEKNWDQSFIQDLHLCLQHDPRAVLTMIPVGYGESQTPPAFITATSFHKDTCIPIFKQVQYERVPTSPQPSLFWSSKCSFSLGDMIKHVQHPDHIWYIDKGHDILMTWLYSKSGYNFFNPREMYVRHNWNKWKHNVIHDENMPIQKKSNTVLQDILLNSSIPTFQTKIGIMFNSQRILGFARSGVSEKPTNEEIFSKYGTLTAYNNKMYGYHAD